MPEAETGSGDAFTAYLISVIVQLRGQLKTARKVSAEIHRRIARAAEEPEFDAVRATGMVDLLDIELVRREDSLATLAGNSRLLLSNPRSAVEMLNDLEGEIDWLISLLESEERSVIQSIEHAVSLRLEKKRAVEAQDAYAAHPVISYFRRVAIIRAWLAFIYILIMVACCLGAYLSSRS